MSRRALAPLLALAMLFIASPAWALTLDDVKEMAEVGVPDNIIVSTIANSEEVFNLTATQIVELKKLGVSDAVVEALQATAGSVTRSEESTREEEEPRRRSSSDDDRDSRSSRDRDDDRDSRSSRDRDDDSDRRRSSYDDEKEDEGLVRRRRGSRDSDRDSDRDSGKKRSRKVKRTPKEIKEAIAAVKDKKSLTGSLKAWRILESNKYPDHEAKTNYWLGVALMQLNMLHSAQVHFQKVVTEGPSGGSVYTNALAKMVEISDRTKDPIYLIRTIDKVNPDDYPGKVKDDLYYYQGVRDFQRKEYSRAKRNFAKLGKSSKHFAQARYHMGVIYSQQDRKKQAFKTFLQIANGDFRGDPTDIAHIRQLAIVNMARIRYEVEQFGKAAEFYGKVPAHTTFWPTALYESAWSHFMAENMENKALGNLLTLSSPFFDRQWLPEANILEALTYYRICEYQEVQNILDDFKEDFTPVQQSVNELLKPYEDGDRPLRDLYQRLYGVKSKDYRKLPIAIYARIEADRDFAGPHNRVLQIERELSMVRSQKASWRDSEAGKGVTDLLKKQRKVYMKFAGAALANELGQVRDEMGELMAQEALIRFEVVSGEYKKYADRFRNPEAAEVDEAEEIDFATNPDLIYWPFNNEFWHDELGYYQRVEPGDCKE